MSKLADDVMAFLKARADQNSDGKLDQVDLEIVAHTIARSVESSTRTYPWGALIVCYLVATSVTYFVMSLAGC